MKNSVVIKGNNYGIVVVLDASIPFDQLKISIASKFKEASGFFGNKPIVISFEGRKLSPQEEKEVIEIITENSEMSIMCIIDNDNVRENQFKAALEGSLSTNTVEKYSDYNQFYKGTLRSGQVLESDKSLVILGDVNPGAKVVSEGNVVILGALKGTVFAGTKGEKSFVIALEMEPMQIGIYDVIARSSDRGNSRNKELDPKIAFLEHENIYIEKLTKDLLNEIRLY